MQASDSLIHTKLHAPSIRPGLVSRPRLHEQIMRGLQGSLTLVVAPPGFGKTTLVASCIVNCGMPVAWLSLDRNDNQTGRFLNYLVAALQETDHPIAVEVAQLMDGRPDVSADRMLTSLVNSLETKQKELALVLDDYHLICNQAVHEETAFLLEHCPNTLHLVIATRSDPPLPLARLRARGQMVELRVADLRFTTSEAAQFLNESMGLHLDAGLIETLEGRTEGWIAGLQMAALSIRDREDVRGFVAGFSGTNRYILDYLLEEVLASQSPSIQRFLLYTSILDRLTAPLCKVVLEDEKMESDIVEKLPSPLTVANMPACEQVLEYLDRANLFVVPLDDQRQSYRYHHLFADLLRARLNQMYPGLEPQLHARAAAWHEQNGTILDAIHHASMVPDDEMVERLITQNYLDMMNRGEMASVRFWMGSLSRELVYRRPWLCLYEAMNHSWFGRMEEADLLLREAEKRIQAQGPAAANRAMLGYHAYVKSRVTAVRGDTHQAIELCLAARENVPADSLDLQIDFSITLGYEYFLYGDFINAKNVLNTTIQSGYIAGAINNPVAAYCLLARSQVYQGRLREVDELLQKAMQLIHEPGDRNLGVVALVQVERAALLCEWNELDAALTHLTTALDDLPWWGKTDDFCLAYITLSRIQLAQGKRIDAANSIKKAAQLTQTCGIFPEARNVVEAAQVKLWLIQGNWPAIDHWGAAMEQRFSSHDTFRYEDELTHITLARVFMAQSKSAKAIRLLSALEESAQAGERAGRMIEILMLKALAMQAVGNTIQAEIDLTKSLALAEPSGYVRLFLDEGQPLKLLLTQWLAHARVNPLQNYAIHLLSAFDAEPLTAPEPKEQLPLNGNPSVRRSESRQVVEQLSKRELEVLYLISLGRTNQEIAHQLIVSAGTVKAHTASIYRKLDVANRTEAVARARQLGFLA